MNQTSFILSGISSNKAAVGEAKSAVSQDVTDMEGEGFFAKLTQFVSGDTEAVEGKQDISLENVESHDVLNEVLVSGASASDGTDVENLALESEDIDTEVSESAEVKTDKAALSEEAALNLKNTDAVADPEKGTTERQWVAKQDGEALLHRLNEANRVLKPQSSTEGESTSDAKGAVTSVGKSLPLSVAESVPNVQESNLAIAATDAASSQSAPDNTLVNPLSVAEVKAVLASEGIDVDALSTQELEAIAVRVLEKDVSASVSGTPNDELQLASGVANRPELAKVTAAESVIEPDAELLAGSAEASRVLSGAVATQVAATTPDVKDANIVAKSGNEPLTQSQQEALLRAQLAAQATSSAEKITGETAELHARSVASQTQNGLTQTASAVQAAVNPQLQNQTPASAFAAIPWTPAVVQNNAEPQLAASSAVLEAGAALQMTEATQAKPDIKAEHLAQQLATSFGNQSSTTAARLDNAVAQTPLQLSQSQTDDAASALQERVNMMMSKNLKHVDIRLDPPELGRMQIKLSMNQDQASVQFTVSNQAARDMVEQTLPRLREMMQQQGLQLAQSSVQQQDAGGRQAFAGNQSQQGDNQSGQGGQDGSSRLGRNDSDHDMDGSSINRELYVNTSKDRVDYYA
ncbi:flagellar hook-length control protein FliK [Enterovibrio nigricans]|uniref:Flagellar hook-length control protein FliK n=1 Tax=Enterovibrio nigricans DSM 22720 TaxID=1121868 RepID=A0A1T4U766_9GAMM|nr:flagellar hook-length control protein FliK [Enterovibrio nigricans]SKA48517.1 flagellar hook-length control protein FliK [Enterovibrio nigricans DSM 22720]